VHGDAEHGPLDTRRRGHAPDPPQHKCEDIMAVLSVPARSYKVYAAWIGEKAARLKLDGFLLTPSPFRKLEALEMMRLASKNRIQLPSFGLPFVVGAAGQI
jgi:hypothetical protein